ncbi:MAG: aldo/keto reductase [Alphaproteobacteria bacterium]|nr:aldo/keto reductase [Alphaproteobacteria bacterium]
MSDPLHTTLLGKRVHRVGLSTEYGLGADGLRAALRHGLNYVWYVRSTEKVATEPLQEACARDRDSVFIATGPSMGYTGGNVKRHCEKVLKRLGTDHVDLLQLFWAGKMSRITDGTLSALTQLREEGKCRGIGVSIHDRAWAGQLARDRVFDVLMVRYNAGHPGAEQDIFPHVGAGEDKVGIVSYTSTRWGTMLTAPSGWTDRPATAAECYSFALTQPAVDVVLTGPASWEQLQHNLDSMEVPMPAEKLAWMRELGQKARGTNPVTGYFTEGF